MRIGISLTNDLVFKLVFGSPAHAHLTLHFLNDLLPLVDRPKASSLTIANPFRHSDFRQGKEITVDVRARDETRRDFQIEMQIRAAAAPAARLLDNWARIYSEQIKKRESYEKHRPVISVWIMEEDLFPEPSWFHRIEPVRDTSGAPFGEDFLVVVIELRKWAALPGRGKEAMFNMGLDRWLAMLVYGQDIDPGKPPYKGLDADLKEVAKIIEFFIGTERMRYRYNRRLDWLRNQEGWKKQALEQGRAEGIAEGKAEGREEGERVRALSDARNLKRLGVAVGIIAEATGLAVEEIEGL